MAVLVRCPSCERKQRVPEKYAGRKVTCPQCGGAVRVPVLEDVPPRTAVSPPAVGLIAFRTAESLSRTARLGVAALGLGLVAILLLCVPFVGYVSPVLSGAGLVLGLGGMFRSWLEHRNGEIASPAEGVQMPDVFGERTVSFPLAGAAVCALAMLMALSPYLFE